MKRSSQRPERKERGPVQDIGSILNKYLSDSDFGLKLKKFSLFNHWPEIVGPDIGKKTTPQKIFKGILYIKVTNSTWANELSMMSEQLIDRINNFIGEEIIKELRFKVQ